MKKIVSENTMYILNENTMYILKSMSATQLKFTFLTAFFIFLKRWFRQSRFNQMMIGKTGLVPATAKYIQSVSAIGF